jgi:hypothetical protein
MTKQERINAFHRIANCANRINSAAKGAIVYAHHIERMDSAEINRLSMLLPQFEETLREIGPYLSPLAEKYLHMSELGISAKEADHRIWVSSQGVWIDSNGIPIDEDGNPIQ